MGLSKRIGELNQLRVGSILTYVNLIISTIIPLLYTPIMLRILGQGEYGVYSLSNSVVGYLGLLTFGMGAAVNRYITEYKVKGDKDLMQRCIGMFIVMYSALAAVVCALGAILPQFAGEFFGEGLTQSEIERLKILIVIMALSTAVSFPTSVFSSIVIVYERYIFRKILDCIFTIAAPVFNLIVLFAGMASVGMAIVALVMQILTGIILWIYCKRRLRVSASFKNMPFYLLKEIWKFSAFIFLSTIVDMLYWATDKVLIGAMVSSVAVAVYNIGGTFTSMLSNMSAAISGVFGTRVTTMVVEERSTSELSELLIRIGRLQYLIVSLVLSGYIVFGRQFILFWAGKGYEKAYYIGLLVMLPLAVPLIQNVAYNIIVAQKRHQFRAIVYAIIAVINVLATYLTIPKFGIIGAAVCTCAAYVLGQGIVMNIFYYKKIGLNIPMFWKNIIKMSIIPAVLCISFLILTYFAPIQSLIVFIVYIVLFLIIFVAFTWFVTMNNYEQGVFKDILKKLISFKGK